MTTKNYDDLMPVYDGYDFISAKELQSRYDTITDENLSDEDKEVYKDEISLIESIFEQFEKNGDQVKDLTRYSQFDRSWAVNQLEDVYQWNSDGLPEAIRNAIDWDDVKQSLIREMTEIEIEGTSYYYEED